MLNCFRVFKPIKRFGFTSTNLKVRQISSTATPDKDLLTELLISVILARLSYEKKTAILSSFEKDIRNGVIPSEIVPSVYAVVPDSFDVHEFPQVAAFNNKKADSHGYGWCKNDVCYIVYRGTIPTSYKDWSRDFLLGTENMVQSLTKPVQVHKGFFRQFNSLDKKVVAFLEENKQNYKSIKFIGHSLGGAMACIGAAKYSHLYNVPVTVHTFACPRVGGADFNTYFNDKVQSNTTWRVYNELDGGPQFPDKGKDFQHTNGNALELKHNGGSEVFLQDVNGNIISLHELLHIITSAEEHETKHYISRLVNLIKNTK